MSNQEEIQKSQPAGTTIRSAVNPAKGIDYYAFVDQGNVSFGIAGGGKVLSEQTLSKPYQIESGNFQIKLLAAGWSARFSWSAYSASEGPVGTHYADIAPLTGNLQDSDMSNMLKTPSVTTPDFALAYGFYDSASGLSGLTNQDQAYVYLTGSRATWMGDLVEELGSALAIKPFNAWVLPGAHDAGMFDPTKLSTLLNNSAYIDAVASMDNPWSQVLRALPEAELQRGLINMAFTQKDNVETMLNLGVRFFDFRPGYVIGSEPRAIYHQHALVPGYPYGDFLADVVLWLVSHPSEIVVVNLNFQGFADPKSMQPEPTLLTDYVSKALEANAPNQSLSLGDKLALSSSYSQLIEKKQRLIFLNQIGENTDASKYDSYNSTQYETTDFKNIISALNKMNRAGQKGYDYTVLQLQGTAAALFRPTVGSFATLSDASSPLLSTKAMFDQTTYPWVLEHAPRNLSPSQLLVLLNDFCDNTLATYAMEITKVRASQDPFTSWPAGAPMNTGDSTSDSPAACVFQNKIYLFWKANDSSNRIFFSASADGQTWPTGAYINDRDASSDSPAVCVFQNKICLFWKANDSSNRIFFSASADGQTWPTGAHINDRDASSDSPAACVFQNKIYLFWKANDPSNQIFFSASGDGQTWPSGRTINGVDSASVSPAACVFQNKIYLFWSVNDPSSQILFSASADGQTWPSGRTINGVDSTPNSAAASVLPPQNAVYLFWKANDPTNRIYYSLESAASH